MNVVRRIAIAWDGLPYYAAVCIAAGIRAVGQEVPVIATPASVPLEGVAERLGQAIHQVGPRDRTRWSDLGLEVPEFFFHTGWAYPCFNFLADEVRARGGRVVAFIDNNWKNTPRQWLGALYYRLLLKRRFAAVWVPGRSGRRFCRFLGVPPHRIYEGLYGADPALYGNDRPLAARPKKILFVGQFIARKGVDYLLEAFTRFHAEHPDWTLRCVGNGPLADAIEGEGITRDPFLQAEDVARIMAESRFLVLPSREEHWGLVVHEAALAGCGLILSDRVGAHPDLATDQNSFVVRLRERGALLRAFEAAAALSGTDLDRVRNGSIEAAARFGPEIWADTFSRIVNEI